MYCQDYPGLGHSPSSPLLMDQLLPLCCTDVQSSTRVEASAGVFTSSLVTTHLPFYHCSTIQRITLHCTKVHCTQLHWTALRCTVLHFTALHCTALHFIYYTALPCTYFTALHCTALHCIVDPSTTIHITRVGWSIVFTVYFTALPTSHKSHVLS